MIVDVGPLSIDLRAFTLASLLAFLGGHTEVVAEGHSPELFVGERKVDLWRHNLQAVGLVMRAYLLRLEQVDVLLVGGHMEIPNALDVLHDAMYWLIGLDKTEQQQNY